MPSVTLAERLRQLRAEAGLTQSQLGKALLVSVPLISSWEKETVPPPHRLDAVARLFARVRVSPAAKPLLVGEGELNAAERAAYHQLRDELDSLRPENATGPAREASSPLRFGVGEAITIVCSELPAARRAAIGAGDPADADFIESYKYADLDALLELLPFVISLNPTSTITVGTASELSPLDLTSHLIALGGVDWNPVTDALMRYLDNVPVRQLKRDTDADSGGFQVSVAGSGRVTLAPKLRPYGDKQALVEDVGHFLRSVNPYNRERTLTIFNGNFNRGSKGVVRALTDPKIQERNAAHVVRRLNDSDTYSVVCRVRIVANEIVVPDWTQDDDRLHEWPEAIA